MEHFKAIKLNLPNSWIDISFENPDGPPTFIRKEWGKNSGVLQISVTHYLSGESFNPNHKDLIELSKEFDSGNEFELIETKSGGCQFGMYGCAEFKNKEFPFVSVWHITDKNDIIFSTYISNTKQTKTDVDEVYDILKNIRH
jgi:hypothetical protein